MNEREQDAAARLTSRFSARGASLPLFDKISRRQALDALIFFGSALGYCLTAIVGTVLSVPPSGFAILWPATAFIIAVLLVTPQSRWWLCVAAVVPTHFYLAATFQPQAPLSVILTQVGGNLLLAFSTVIALRVTIGERIRFDTLDSVVKYMLIAGWAVPAIVNLLILAVHVGTGWTADLWLSWRQWMLSSIFPTITIPPLFALALTGRLAGAQTASAKHGLEFALLCLVLLFVGYEAFGESADTTHWPALFLLPMPFLIWAAVRLGVGGTCLALLVVATPTVIRALQHQGPFAHLAPVEGIVSLQLFLIVTSVPLILLAALLDELRRTTTLLRQSESRMKVTASATDTGLWQWDGNTRQLWLTDHCREMFDLSEEAPFTPYAFLETVDPDDRDRLEKDIDLAMAVPDSWPGRHYKFHGGGRTRWLLLQMYSQIEKTGHAQVSGVFRDVTSRVIAEQDADELRQRLRRLREDERRRIAEDLHDSTAQHLVAARLKLSALKAEAQSASMRRIVAAAMKSLREATLEIRTFSYLLHPPQLRQTGLSGVLQEYLPGFESRTGVATSLRITPLVDLLSADQQHAILRVAQESLTNVHRHARATRVSVTVRCIAGNVHLIVADDGKGIHIRDGQELSDRLRLGVGIPGMTARVQRLGGRINVDSGGKGTTVHVTIPLADPGESPSLH